jgi:peroxiredoxin
MDEVEHPHDDDEEEDLPREARLGGQVVRLMGRAPRPGDHLVRSFRVPEARRANHPLETSTLRDGLVIVSTLPNIAKRACTAQVVKLEAARKALDGLRIFHVASDGLLAWDEVEQFHPDVAAPGYALKAASPFDAAAFKRAFGVGVEGSHRIAHGLFALKNGVFLLVDIPFDQFRTPSVERFMYRARAIVDSFSTSPTRCEREGSHPRA